MRSIPLRRLVLPVSAGLVTSAAVAAFGIAGQSASRAAPQAPTPSGQVAGQLTLGTGAPIPILSFSAGGSNPTTIGSGGGGAGTGKVSLSSLNMMKAVDANTPPLYLAMAKGQHFSNAVFTAQWGAGGSAATLKYELEQVFVESLQQSGGGAGAPTESLSVAFAKVRWTYTDAAGSTTGSWNIAENKE